MSIYIKYIYKYMYICICSARGNSKRPRLLKAHEAHKAPDAVQSVRCLLKRLRLLKAHCVLGSELYSLAVS